MTDSSGVESIIRMGRLTTSISLQRKTNSLPSGCLIVDDTMTPKEYWQMTKWEWFIEGFRNISYIMDCYETVEHFPDDFWESLSWGWLNMEGEYRMSQPGFDPYNLRGRDSYYSYIMSNK